MARVRDDSKIETIYNATLKLVLETGFNGLKMAEVASAAGVATGTLYIYFKNKEVLINQLFLHLKKNKTDQVLKVFNPDDSFAVSFKKLWTSYLNISLKEPERMIFIEQFIRSSYLTKKTKMQADLMLKPLEEFLEAGKLQQIVKDLPTALLLGQLIGPINEIVKLQYDHKIKITPVLTEECFQMAWSSIKS